MRTARDGIQQKKHTIEATLQHRCHGRWLREDSSTWTPNTYLMHSVHLSASQCTQCTLHHSPSDFRLQQLFYTAYLWHFGSFEVSVVCVTFQNFWGRGANALGGREHLRHKGKTMPCRRVASNLGVMCEGNDLRWPNYTILYSDPLWSFERGIFLTPSWIWDISGYFAWFWVGICP